MKKIKDYLVFIPKINRRILEDLEYIPRFSVKDITEINGIPINSPLSPTKELFIKAIKYGMVFNIQYKGFKDKSSNGFDRTIYPMVIGKSAKGDILIRGYHLVGWSVSANNHISKVWRMFRLSNVKKLIFTGSFFRLPPLGYNMQDRGMKGGIIARADFGEIRRNQQSLVKKDEIENKDDITLENDKENDNKEVKIKVKSTDTKLDLNNALENQYINNIKDIKNLRVSMVINI